MLKVTYQRHGPADTRSKCHNSRTVISPFSRVHTSRFRKLAGTPQEHKHVTPALQWIAASELLDSSYRSSSCTTWYSRGWRGKSSSSYHSVCAKKKNPLKHTKTLSHHQLNALHLKKNQYKVSLKSFKKPLHMFRLLESHHQGGHTTARFKKHVRAFV
jgi:hypothetical protein